MMTLSNTMSQVHQDFADAGRTKALPPALLAAYDTRHPANNAAARIAEETPLLRGRINSTGTAVGKSSAQIFLSSQILQFVKHCLTGAVSVNDAQFIEQAEASFTNRESLERWVKAHVALLDVMCEIIPDWGEIAQLSPPDSNDSAAVTQRTKEIKQRLNVPMTGAFLNALGLVAHHVLCDATDNENADKDAAAWREELKQSLAPLREVDWSRKAEIWDGNIVVAGDKIRTQAPAVKGAADKMTALLNQDSQSLAE